MSVRSMVKGALIGALYAVLTFCVAPIASGLVQVRVSEALCVLPAFTAAAVPGLFVGCVIANLVMGSAAYDVIFGGLATLLSAYLTRVLYKAGASKWLYPLPAVLINAAVVGWVLSDIYGLGVYWLCAAYVGAGQLIACYVLGMPLWFLLNRHRDFIER